MNKPLGYLRTIPSTYKNLFTGVFLFLLYFLTARFGLWLGAVSGFATLIWIPSGLSVAALYLFGFHLWPAITVAAFLANYTTGAPLPVALSIGIGNTLEAAVAVYILHHYCNFRSQLDRLQDVIFLIMVAGVMSTIISPTVGVTGLWIGNIVSSENYESTWVAWYIGDMISMVTIAPFILVLKETREWKKSQIVELILAFLALTIACVLVVTNVFNIVPVPAPISYLIYPPLIWICLRFTQKETLTAIILTSIIVIWGTWKGIGSFSSSDVNISLMYLQSFMVVTSSTAMILSAVVTERRRYAGLKDELMAIVSHELKTPLTSIKAYTQLMQKLFTEKKDHNSVTYMRKVDIQITKLTKIVDDLLAVSMIHERKFKLNKDYFSLQDLIEETVDTIQASSNTHTIIVQSSLPAHVYGDKDRIEQVLVNLLSNAIKYSPKGETIVISTERHNNHIIVNVKDNGIGIPERYGSKIFTQYYRISDKTKSGTSGFGMGLYLSREIVLRHGGEMWFKSKEGEGSIFSFTINLK